jgi:Ca-activated chloride channel family protein
MKSSLTFIALLMACFLHGQEWVDSVQKARSYYKKGDHRKALRYYESAEQKGAKKVNFDAEKGQNAYRERDYESAERFYQNRLSKEKAAQKKAKYYHNIGNAQLKQKKYDEAIKSYKQALKANPNNKKTRYNLSEALRMKKNQDQRNDKDNSQCKNPGDKQGQNNKNSNSNGKNPPKNGKGNPSQQNGQNSQSGQNDRNSRNQNSSIRDSESEKMLDDLMRAETKTKRKIGGNHGEEGTRKTKKDW